MALPTAQFQTRHSKIKGALYGLLVGDAMATLLTTFRRALGVVMERKAWLYWTHFWRATP